jgi:hypothetical protein
MRMLALAVSLAVSLGVLGSAASADVAVFDFEALAGNDDNTAGDHIALSVQAGDLFAVITRTSGERFTVWNSGGRDVPARWGAKHLSPVFNYVIDDYLVMSFSEPLTGVAIEFGDYGEDNDLAELYAYGEIHGTGELLGQVSGSLGSRDMRWDDPTRLEFFAEPGEEIWSIRFRGGRDPFLQSTFIDNIVAHVAPSPGTTTAFGLALGTLAGRRRERSRRR